MIQFSQKCVPKGKTKNIEFKNNFFHITKYYSSSFINKNESKEWIINGNAYYDVMVFIIKIFGIVQMVLDVLFLIF